MDRPMGTFFTPFIISNLFCLFPTSNENFIDSKVCPSFLGFFFFFYLTSTIRKISHSFILKKKYSDFKISVATFVPKSVTLLKFLTPVPFAGTKYTNNLLCLAKGFPQFRSRTLLRLHYLSPTPIVYTLLLTSILEFAPLPLYVQQQLSWRRI